MNKKAFIIFFSIVLTIYGLVNYYIFIKGWYIISLFPQYKIFYLIIFLFLSLSFIAGRFLERARLNKFTSFLVWVGSFWLGAMTYFFLINIVYDSLRLILYLCKFSYFEMVNEPRFNILMGEVEIIAVLFLLIIGYINSIHPCIKKIELNIHKEANKLMSINIAAASDIHLGTIISKSRLERIVNKINGLNADVVLFPGDVIDEDIGPVIKNNLGETLRKIRSKYGVYAITGNHEYIGGVEKACKYLTEHGIRMLRDEYLKINESVYIIGREDMSIKGFTRKLRKPLDEIIKEVDKNLPMILMDHQPVKLNEAVENEIDIQLSGHTHHGQLFPFNFITKKVYDLSYGYLQRKNTKFYVSCGAGTWGPPMRTNSRPEIVNLIIKFDE